MLLIFKLYCKLKYSVFTHNSVDSRTTENSVKNAETCVAPCLYLNVVDHLKTFGIDPGFPVILQPCQPLAIPLVGHFPEQSKEILLMMDHRAKTSGRLWTKILQGRKRIERKLAFCRWP